MPPFTTAAGAGLPSPQSPAIGDEHGFGRPARLGAHGLDLLDHVHAPPDLPDDYMLAAALTQRQHKDLAAAGGATTCKSTPQDLRADHGIALDEHRVGRVVSAEVAVVDHDVGDDLVQPRVLKVIAAAQRQEVLRGLRSLACMEPS